MGWLADLVRCVPCDEKPIMGEREARTLAAHTRRLQRTTTTPTGYLTPFPCPAGNGWHVTRTVPPSEEDDPVR